MESCDVMDCALVAAEIPMAIETGMPGMALRFLGHEMSGSRECS